MLRHNLSSIATRTLDFNVIMYLIQFRLIMYDVGCNV